MSEEDEFRIRIGNAMIAAIVRMRVAGLGATGEYNDLWTALAEVVGDDEWKMRAEFSEMTEVRY